MTRAAGVALAGALGLSLVGSLSGLLAGCGGSSKAVTSPASSASAPASAASAAAGPRASAERGGADALGSPPALGAPKPFAPPTPKELRTPAGFRVWLVERRGLPLVSVMVAVPRGAADDPPQKPGLASVAADMMNEGAGKLGALELSAALDSLGAAAGTFASYDGSFAYLTTLRRSLPEATALLADIVARPRFETKEWSRVTALRKNALRARAADPDEVLDVVGRAAAFGLASPYGHPLDGTLATFDTISLEDAKRFHQSAFRPEAATFVVAGDIGASEAQKLVDDAFGSWKSAPPRESPAPPPAPEAPTKAVGPRLVLVDRPDAPQALVAWVAPAARAGEPVTAGLTLANLAFGGTFASRLNLSLREEKGWTYHAGSSFRPFRRTGLVRAVAAVVEEHVGEALVAMLAEMRAFGAGGLREGELPGTKAQARSAEVESFELVDGTTQRLADAAAMGLPAAYRTQENERREAATKADVEAAARVWFDEGRGALVIVGPKDKLLPQLRAAKLGEPVLWNEEARPVTPRRP